MTKEEARNYFFKKRLSLSETDVENVSFQIFTQWKNSDLIHFNSFHIFLSIKEKKEVNTLPFIEFFWERKKKVYTSKVEGDFLLHYELTAETSLRINSWGIPEPVDQEPVRLQEIDCVLVPLLACDLQGNRVGYGKGYYDRFLYEFPQAQKTGLSFFEPIAEIEDIGASDIPLDYVVTPDYFLGFSVFPMEEK